MAHGDKLRFCLVTTFYPPDHFGGDALHVYWLANALARRGHLVEVIYDREAYRVLGGLPREETYPHHPNVTVHRLESPWGRFGPLITYLTGFPGPTAGRLRRLLDQPYDVIHFHNVSLVGGPGILHYGRGLKLYTTHEFWLVCPTHLLFKFQRAICEKKQCLACTLIHGRPPQLWRYTSLLERQARAVKCFIAPTRAVIARHRAMGWQVPMEHLPEFLPTSDGVLEGPSPEGPYFLYVGRLSHPKGVDRLVEAARQIPEARFLLVGEGEGRPALERQAASLPNIQLLGPQGRGRLQSLYKSAIALVLPTRSLEVFGLVVLEAFAAGIPVVTSANGGPEELVRESGGGMIFRDQNDFVRCLLTLLGDPALRGAQGERGRAAFLTHWTEERFMERYLALVDRLRTEQPAVQSPC